MAAICLGVNVLTDHWNWPGTTTNHYKPMCVFHGIYSILCMLWIVWRRIMVILRVPYTTSLHNVCAWICLGCKMAPSPGWEKGPLTHYALFSWGRFQYQLRHLVIRLKSKPTRLLWNIDKQHSMANVWQLAKFQRNPCIPDSKRPLGQPWFDIDVTFSYQIDV